MSQFTDLLQAVKDEHLTLAACEKLRDEMIHLHSMMQVELAGLEKDEAIYITQFDAEITDAARKRTWKATPEGQRQIEINRYIKAIVKEIDSLKSRVYRLI